MSPSAVSRNMLQTLFTWEVFYTAEISKRDVGPARGEGQLGVRSRRWRGGGGSRSCISREL